MNEGLGAVWMSVGAVGRGAAWPGMADSSLMRHKYNHSILAHTEYVIAFQAVCVVLKDERTGFYFGAIDKQLFVVDM